MKNLILLLIFTCSATWTSAQFTLTGTFSNTKGNRYEIFLKNIKPDSEAQSAEQWKVSSDAKDAFKLKIPLSEADFFNMSIIVHRADGNKSNYNYTLYVQPQKKLHLSFSGRDQMGLTALYESIKDNNNKALFNLNEKSAQQLSSLYKAKIDSSALKNGLSNLLEVAIQAANTKGIAAPVKDYLLMQGYNQYISNLYRFGMDYKISLQDSAFYKLPEGASWYFNHELFNSFYEAPSNLINGLDIALGLKPYTRKKTLAQLAEQIELLTLKTSNPTVKNLIIERLLNQYVNAYKADKDFEKDLELFSVLADKVTNTESQASLITSFKNLKYMLVGAPWPAVKVQDAAGNWINLDQFKGKYLFVDLWASWCGPCIKMTPYVQQLEEKFKQHNITFVAISIDNQADKWKAKMKELKLEQHQYIDVKGELAKQLNVTGIPHYLLYSPEGKLLIYKTDMPNNPKLEEILSGFLK